MKWGDVDSGTLEVDVRRSVVAGRENTTKTEASEKPVPPDPAIATTLLKRRGQARYLADSDFALAGDSGRPRWQALIVKDHIQPAAHRAAIGRVGWHTFRYTSRARLKRCGTPLGSPRDLMRHANVRVTADVYGLGRNLSSAHRKANTAVVKTLLGE